MASATIDENELRGTFPSRPNEAIYNKPQLSERKVILTLAEEFLVATLLDKILPSLPQNFLELLENNQEYYLHDLICLLYPNIFKPYTSHVDYVTETDKLMRTAMLTKNSIIGLISLFNNMQSIPPSIVACGIINLASRPGTTTDGKFWAVLYLTYQECNGVFTESLLASTVATSILKLISELPVDIARELRFFMNCNIINQAQIDFYWSAMMHGLLSIPNLGNPTSAGDFERLMNKLHGFMYDDYSKNLAFNSLKILTAENTVVIAKFLKEHGSEFGRDFGKGMYTLATHEDTKAVALEASKILLTAVYGSVVGAGYFFYNTALTAGQIAMFGWKTRDVPIRMINNAISLIRVFSGVLIKPRITNPLLGSAAMHAILPAVDDLIVCKDSSNQTEEYDEYFDSETGSETFDFSTQTDTEPIHVCPVITPQIIEKEIIKYVDKIVYVPSTVPATICPPCPECPSASFASYGSTYSKPSKKTSKRSSKRSYTKRKPSTRKRSYSRIKTKPRNSRRRTASKKRKPVKRR